MIEVEQKFSWNDQCENQLNTLGAELVKHITYKDTYYDTAGSFTLTLADHWLRNRNGTWELKHPPFESVDNACSRQHTTQYVETVNEGEITGKLSLLLKMPPKDNMKINDLIARTDLQPFATIISNRKTYTLDECRIDLDVADFGYQVGEIEVMVDSSESIPKAKEKIQEVANKIGVPQTVRVPGKMHMYLKQYNQQLYQKLLDASVL